jgi:signal transduction histidine kinase
MGPRRTLEVGRQLTELALSVGTYGELVSGITAVVAPLLDASKSGVAIWHRERGYLELLPGSFGASAEVVASSRVMATEVRSQAGRVMMSGQAQYTNHAQTDVPLYRSHFDAMGVSQLLTMPILAPGRTLGVLHVANKRTRFSRSDATRLEPIMPFVATLVEHVRDRFDMLEREKLAAAVARAATAIAAGQVLTRFSGLLDEFCAAIRAQMLSVVFSDDSPPIVIRPGRVDAEIEHLFMTQSSRDRSTARTNMVPSRGAGDGGWAALHVPVLVAGELKATLSLLRMPYEPFVEHERDSIRRLADVVALAWATERYHSERTQIVRLRERQRIADDLHDHVAQIMFSGQLILESVLERIDRDAAVVADLARTRNILIHSQNSMREVIDQLSGSDQMTLAAQLGEVAQNVEDEFDVLIHVDVAEQRIELLDSASSALTETALGAAREGMVNAAKYAGSGQIWVSMRVTSRRRLIITVDDSGPGISTAVRSRHDGHGLPAIRRRLSRHQGTLRISRSDHGGARLTVSLPLPAPIAARRGPGGK